MRTALKLERVKHGLTQEQAGAKLGYSRNHYAKIENGTQEITYKFLRAVCEVYEKTLEEAKELTKRDENK